MSALRLVCCVAFVTFPVHANYAADFFPNLSQAHLEAGKSYLNKGDIDRAIKEFQSAIRLDPTDGQAHSNMGYALARKGDLGRAIAAYRNAITLQLDDPAYSEVQLNLGYALGGHGDLDGAIAAWRESMRLRPHDATVRQSLRSIMQRIRNLEKVIAGWERVVQARPQDPLAFFSLGVALKEKGDTEGAIRAFRETVRLNPEDALGFILLAKTLGHAGHTEEEIAALRNAIRLTANDPDYVELYVHLAYALGRQGDLDGATAVWRDGFARHLSNVHIPSGFELHNIERSYVEWAISAWGQAVRFDPTGLEPARIHHQLGEGLARQGLWKEAIKVYGRIAQQNPHDGGAREKWVAAYRNMGHQYLEKGWIDGAIHAFHAVLQADPADEDAKAALSMAVIAQQARARE